MRILIAALIYLTLFSVQAAAETRCSEQGGAFLPWKGCTIPLAD